VILVDLLVGCLEIAAFGLVLPGEPAALPDVGKTFIVGAGLCDVLFKGVAAAVRVMLVRAGHAESIAEVAEVILVAGSLGERRLLPFADEVQDVEGHAGDRELFSQS